MDNASWLGGMKRLFGLSSGSFRWTTQKTQVLTKRLNGADFWVTFSLRETSSFLKSSILAESAFTSIKGVSKCASRAQDKGVQEHGVQDRRVPQLFLAGKPLRLQQRRSQGHFFCRGRALGRSIWARFLRAATLALSCQWSSQTRPTPTRPAQRRSWPTCCKSSRKAGALGRRPQRYAPQITSRESEAHSRRQHVPHLRTVGPRRNWEGRSSGSFFIVTLQEASETTCSKSRGSGAITWP
jgi:hypothetical protein